MREMEYKRKVDKKRIPTCNIMGVNIAAINMEWLVDYLEKNISEIKGDYICVSNVHTTVTSFEDADYCAIQNGGARDIIRGCHNRDKGTAENERLRDPKFIFSYPKNERMIFLSGRNAAQEEISTMRVG